MADFKRTKPPHNTLVEVMEVDHVIRVKAIFGGDGVRPHWETEDGSRQWEPSAFDAWRPITEENI